MTGYGHLTRSAQTTLLRRTRHEVGLNPDDVYAALTRIEHTSRTTHRPRHVPPATHVALVIRREARRTTNPRLRTLLLTLAADEALGRTHLWGR